MKLLVTGGRHFAAFTRDAPRLEQRERVRLQTRQLFATLDAFHAAQAGAPWVLVHGDADGADSLAARWADGHDVIAVPYPADWYPHGVLDNRAGPERNARMVADSRPDWFTAFAGNRGTGDCTRLCLAAGVKQWPVAP